MFSCYTIFDKNLSDSIAEASEENLVRTVAIKFAITEYESQTPTVV